MSNLLKSIASKRNLYFATCLIIVMAFTSCQGANQEQSQPQQEKPSAKNSIIKKPGSSYTDTITINMRAAVFYSPDSLQMGKIKAVNEKNIFDMLVHDCHYQMQNARNSLKQDWPQIKIIDAVKARYLLFIKEDKSKICIDLDSKNDICGLFLFDTKKSPILVDMPNIDTILQSYFSH